VAHRSKLPWTVACEIGAIPAMAWNSRWRVRRNGDNAESAQWPSDRAANATASPITDL